VIDPVTAPWDGLPEFPGPAYVPDVPPAPLEPLWVRGLRWLFRYMGAPG